jgi:hypothetical protein
VVIISKSLHDAILSEWADKGEILKGGFMVFRAAMLPIDATPGQIEAARYAFMAGAQHLFASIMATLDEDKEPTEKDLRVMELISKELSTWDDEARLRFTDVGGTG